MINDAQRVHRVRIIISRRTSLLLGRSTPHGDDRSQLAIAALLPDPVGNAPFLWIRARHCPWTR